jgi:TorA maturation chaperone TorD
LNNKDIQQFSQDAYRRSDVYGLLSSVYSQEPDKGFIEHIQNDKSLRLLIARGGMWDEKFWALSEQEIYERLAVEYTRLFVGPKDHIPPLESLYNHDEGETRQIWGSATVEVKKLIESSGLSFIKDYGGIPDHISIEFEFMQKLVEKEGELWGKKGNDSQLHKTIELEMRFINEHLKMWIPDFCQKVIEAAQLDFYKNFAELTKDFIVTEEEEIERLFAFLND